MTTPNQYAQPVAPATGSVERQRNRYGYLLDDLRQPKCPHCGESTNKSYRELPNLKCWNCGREMTPNNRASDSEVKLKSGDHVIMNGAGWMVWEDKGHAVMIFNFHGAVIVVPRPIVKPDPAWHPPNNQGQP